MVTHPTDDFAASATSSSPAVLFDRSSSPLPVMFPKLEENPSPIPVKAEAYPPLPPPQEPVPTPVTTPLSYGPVLINGVYYQPILSPHNEVVAQSSVPTLTIVPCIEKATAPLQPVFVEPTEPLQLTALAATAETPPSAKPPIGLEFVMPKTPPSKKPVQSSKKAASQSLSSSRQQKSPVKTSPEVRPTGRGCGKKKVEMSNTPILIPMTHSHLLSTVKPRPGLTISFATDDSAPRSVKITAAAVQQLSHLTTETATPLEVNGTLTADTMVVFKPSQVQDDSDVDLETGEANVPTKPPP